MATSNLPTFTPAAPSISREFYTKDGTNTVSNDGIGANNLAGIRRIASPAVPGVTFLIYKQAAHTTDRGVSCYHLLEVHEGESGVIHHGAVYPANYWSKALEKMESYALRKLGNIGVARANGEYVSLFETDERYPKLQARRASREEGRKKKAAELKGEFDKAFEKFGAVGLLQILELARIVKRANDLDLVDAGFPAEYGVKVAVALASL